MMGESNPEAVALIKDLTGHVPQHGTDPEGIQFLRIGDIIITATEYALWSDPSVYVYSDSMFMLSWGGQNVRISLNAHGAWAADIHRDPLAGKARWTS